MSPSRRFTTRTILPAPACDLLDRLTHELGVRFTLTDLHGIVVASTAGHKAGEVDPHAQAIPDARADGPQIQDPPLPGAYVPLELRGHRAGTLVAYGEAGTLEAIARVASASIGLALDFAEAASSMGHDRVSPGWLLYRLLRGSPPEASQARLIASIFGWELSLQRVALVIEVHRSAGDPPRTAAEPQQTLERILGDPREVPYGHVGEDEWVVLVGYEPGMPWRRVHDLADAIRREVSASGLPIAIGVGEPHLPVRPLAALRRSYREAGYALRVGAQLSGGPGVFELRGLGPAAFFAPSSPTRRKLAALALGPLQEQPGLLETLETYLAHDLSVSATADRLGVHRHTVRNHLQRIAEVAGFDPRTLDGAVQLKLALLVTHADMGGLED